MAAKFRILNWYIKVFSDRKRKIGKILKDEDTLSVYKVENGIIMHIVVSKRKYF